MAPTSSESSDMSLLVTNKKASYIELLSKALRDFPLTKADGFYVINDDDKCETLINKMSYVLGKPVSRIFYIDSDNDEVPIDSEVELKEALKIIGERSNQDKLTQMRLKTGGATELKSLKPLVKTGMSAENLVNVGSTISTRKPKTSKPMKTMKAVARSKSSTPRSVPHGETSNKAPSPRAAMTLTAALKTQKNNSFSATSSLAPPDPQPAVTQAWLEDKLKQFKTELLTDFKVLLEHYIQVPKELSALVSSFDTLKLEAKNSCFESVDRRPESDHNYSAPSDPGNFQGSDVDAKNQTEPSEQTLHSNNEHHDNFVIEANKEHTIQCSHIHNDDENFSIYSGEFSVTDSESDFEGIAEDFVDVPLPACFNVISSQPGNSLDVRNEIKVSQVKDACGLTKTNKESIERMNHGSNATQEDLLEVGGDQESNDDHAEKNNKKEVGTSTSSGHHESTETSRQLLAQEQNQLEHSIQEAKTSAQCGTSHNFPVSTCWETPQVTMPLHPTPARIVEQHQQIIEAAQRAARQAQQTGELYHSLAQLDQLRSKLSDLASKRQCVISLDDLSVNSFQSTSKTENSSHGNKNHSNCTCEGERQNSHCSVHESGSKPHQVEEAVQKAQLWSEVNRVDLELWKWVQMCHNLIQQVPKQIAESSTMPHNMKELSATIATETLQDLEKVYEKFREEVKMVSTQSDPQNDPQLQSGQSSQIDPINILPEKLMQIISSTLNTTFSILGKISKLGIMNAPSLASSVVGSLSVSKEKPQPQQSTAGLGSSSRLVFPPQATPYGYYWPWLQHDLQNRVVCGTPSEGFGPVSNSTYRLCPSVVPSSYGVNNRQLNWGQNLSAFTHPYGHTNMHPSWAVLGDPNQQHTLPHHMPQQPLPQLRQQRQL